MESMVNLLMVTCEQYDAADGLSMEDKLMKAIFDELYVKLAKKEFEVQKHYQVDMKPSWCIAFYMLFNQSLDLKSYEGNLVQGICNRIHQSIQ